MTTELRFLVASVLLGLVHLIASSHLISWQRGYRWTAGRREGQSRPLSGVANRVDQATTNFLETFPFFVALVFVARVTIVGAHFYFWGRLGYLLAAAAGFSLVRSVLCWNIAVIGILLFVVALLWEPSTNYA